VATPKFKDTTNQPTDYNDLYCNEGIKEVSRQINSVLNQSDLNNKLTALSVKELLNKDIPPRTNLLEPWLPSQGICMIHAQRGVGKTHVALGIACAVATGNSFLTWEAPKPAGVLLLDGEMPAKTMQERLKSIVDGMGCQAPTNLKIITPDFQKYGMPNLSSLEGQNEINKLITDDVKLIIVDNISTLVRGGRENEAESWLPVQEWALRLRAQGKTVLFIHHSNKGGGQRGTSKREDILDTVISLRHTKDYDPKNGAYFEVHFEKSRGIHGNDVKPFEAQLQHGEGEIAHWRIKNLEDSTYDKIIGLTAEGFKPQEISDMTGVHKSTVSRNLKKARENGELIYPK
jgi:AAA domain/Homeodomain-like domain